MMVNMRGSRMHKSILVEPTRDKYCYLSGHLAIVLDVDAATDHGQYVGYLL
jgi:hypothetical protein